MHVTFAAVTAFLKNMLWRMLAVTLVAVAMSAGPATAKIAFSWNQCPTGADDNSCDAIWAANDDGTGARIVTSGPPYHASWPVWSPDGIQIAYIGRDPFYSYGASVAGPPSIRVVNADGTGERTILSDVPNEQAYVTDWSTDGQWLLFASSAGGSGYAQGELWVIHPDGTGLTRVYMEPGYLAEWPKFSPDGSRITFIRAGFPNDTARRPYSIKLDGTDQAPVAVGTAGFSADNLNFSPDGRIVAFVDPHTNQAPTGNGIYILNLETGTQRHLTSLRVAWNWSWSAIGPSLFTSGMNPSRPDAPAPVAVYRIDLSQSDPEAVRISEYGASNPVWSGGADAFDRPAHDTTPPAVVVSDAGSGGSPQATSTARATEAAATSRDAVPFFVADPGGVTRVRAAVATRISDDRPRRGRGSPQRRHVKLGTRSGRCRFFTPDGHSIDRRCGRPLFFAVRTSADWIRAARRTPDRNVHVWFTATDSAGNTTKRVHLIR